jgi:uncharacterized protein DUF5684
METGNQGNEVQMEDSILMIAYVVAAIVVLISIIGIWKVFTKAGWPGIFAIIPIVNLYALIKISGKPGWWIILCMIPYLNILFLIFVYVGLARQFGKGIGFALGLLFLSPIYICILGFGEARYIQPSFR